jgi:GNAT superfamily N-acetyltransferase
MGVEIRVAGEADRELVARLLDDAFRDDPVSRWVFPGEEVFRVWHPKLMAAFVDIVLAGGYVHLTEDATACALWLPVPAGAPGADEDQDGAARISEAVPPGNERVELIGRLQAGVHPTDRAHEYLWMLGVHPSHQRQGLGSALLRHVLDRCDREGRAAYLEASNSRSAKLYERLGFGHTGRTLTLPDGPRMWPMWRDPRS